MCAASSGESHTKLWVQRVPSTKWGTRSVEKSAKSLTMVRQDHPISSSILIAATLLALNASPAQTETIDIFDDHGGSASNYAARWAQYRRDGIHVRVAGPCESECTMVVGNLRREHICVTPEGRFGFRLTDLPRVTATLWKSYPTDIKIWLSQHGGLTHQFIWLRAPEVYRFFRQCEEVPRYSSFSVVK
jgi:hypothetical protein